MQFQSKFIVPIGAEGIHVLNTGDWRTQKPILSQDLCIHCGKCFLYCPVNSIDKKDGKFIISYDYCKGCGICAHECPQNAIKMIAEEGK